MSDYLPSFIVEPVLRQARRFSSRTPYSHADSQLEPQPRALALELDLALPRPNVHDAHHNPDLDPSQLSHPQSTQISYLPSVPDFHRFYPSRLWNTITPPPNGRDETTEGTWQSLARNIQLWANQLNNLDVIPSPPLDSMQDHAIVEEDERLTFPQLPPLPQIPPLDDPVTESDLSRPIRLEDNRTVSETSLNPAHELTFRSRALADVNRGHSQSDTVAHPGTEHVPSHLDPMPIDPQENDYRRRDGSGQLPEDDGMGALRQRINVIMAGPGTSAEKSKLVHILMTESYTRSQTPPPTRGRSRAQPSDRPTSLLSLHSTHSALPAWYLSEADLIPSYAPLDTEDGAIVQSKADLGCQHYKRNVKMQCAICQKWYTCRLCHDELEDHILPRRDTKYMLCMLCQTPQTVGQTCKQCMAEAACYYCSICKLWNNDPEKSVYHCDDCGICRLGKGLGRDFFHCKTCAACMSIQAETTHKCIERSTKCDCPICGEYMFTSNSPVAFMKCGHSIHESCFTEWCNTSYKCPICSKSIANMETQFRRLDHHIDGQPMPEEYRENRAYVFCNDCNSRSITKYHWLGLKCSICESYNTTQLELLGPEQSPQQIQELNERAFESGEAGLTASQSHTPSNELTSPAPDVAVPSQSLTPRERAQSPTSPHLLPHSPTRSARSVTPVVGSYFGTGQRPEDDRRSSYFSIFSAGQPITPQSSRDVRESDENMYFWGGHSPRDDDADMEDAEVSDDSAGSSDEAMTEEDDEEEELEGMDLIGHR